VGSTTRLDCCEALPAALDHIADKNRRNGLAAEQLFNMTTGESRVEVIVRAGKKYAVLAFCPFCGEKLEPAHAEE